MSARRSYRGLAASFTVVATATLIGFGSAVAGADPPALDPETCGNVLDRAQAWPGTLDDDVRLVSDGYGSYLARDPVCQTQM
jgi:hypothetical protein